MGLSNGLRNKFAEALAKKDMKLAQVYTSTTYAAVSAVGVVIILIGFILYSLFDLGQALNFTDIAAQETEDLILVVLIFFTIRLIAGLIFALLAADQKVSMIGLVDLLTNVVSLVCIFLLKQFTYDSLFLVGFLFSFVIAFVPLVASFWFFSSTYSKFVPNLKYVNFKHAKDLLKLGGNFFFLQGAVIILFFSNNIIISAILGPEQVTIFNIPYKYIGIITMLSVIILNPFWTAATEAFQKDNFNWLRKTSRNLVIIWFLLSLITLTMVIVSPIVYHFWIGNEVHIPFTITTLVGVYVALLAWINTFGYLLNGIGKIKIQLYAYLFAAIGLFPLAYLLAQKLNFGLEGILVANILCILPAGILVPLQFWLILNKRATGLFTK
nr:MATE family efflux transporter [Pontibacter ummariensis]